MEEGVCGDPEYDPAEDADGMEDDEDEENR